ncbi:olfactory receptor 14C36-like isoform X2 [Mauremys reevesii]|uniref:olfactory receptor 14C36-like isoform X2 n=1 Tax=Mauremys reevesii TaxID=260615 RepID=UPI00193FC495|nr:olfactory receptor 14C36-like isoform X2 [Mauremys reevesii]
MAYDRYVAICQPLHYERVMNRRACVQMAASAWITSIVYSALHTGNTFRLPFCQSNVINQFFCEIPQLLKLTCSDSYLSEVWALAFAIFAYQKPTSSSASGLDLVVGVLYSLVPPVMNPIIYSMRNKEIKAALKKLIVWRLFTKS